MRRASIFTVSPTGFDYPNRLPFCLHFASRRFDQIRPVHPLTRSSSLASLPMTSIGGE
jgi:hypothetical protein